MARNTLIAAVFAGFLLLAAISYHLYTTRVFKVHLVVNELQIEQYEKWIGREHEFVPGPDQKIRKKMDCLWKS